ncbi:MAG: TonB-dependent receptor [SAR86 cluster bacterium]|jgi:outer membrane receptor protein involved in Fe transport
MKSLNVIKVRPLHYLMTMLLAWQMNAVAQDIDQSMQVSSQEPEQSVAALTEFRQQMEEVVVLGRLRTAAAKLVDERMSEDVVADFMGAEMIQRIGDSTVAAALRRVSGLSLVGNKFVYVRGLGERYSSTTLNGAVIPSPDLSRNVIPLDIFPTSVVQTLAVQKSYSPDKSAAFGGGSIDIRTRGIPDDFTYSVTIGSGFNTASRGEMLTYQGGDDDSLGEDDGTRALAPSLSQAVQRFSGNLNAQAILSGLRREGDPAAVLADAEVINRQLALGLNRDISIYKQDSTPDVDLKGSIGNNYILTDDWEVGFLASAGYKSGWRQTQTIARSLALPTEEYESEQESTKSTDLSATINLGAHYTDDHELKMTSLYLRNTDDEVARNDFFNENAQLSSGLGFRRETLKFEERHLTVNQISGEHFLGAETRSLLHGLVPEWVPDGFKVDWMYSDARARTSIPNEVSVSSSTVNDPLTGAVERASVNLSSSAADFRFTQLDDDVTSYRWQAVLPIETAKSIIELSAGAEHGQKSRTYRQAQFGLGPLQVDVPSVLTGPLGTVFSDANVTNPANGFVFDLIGTNNQSYLAATMTDAVFGNLDWTLDDRWRASVGARWEDYKQVALDWNIFGNGIDNPQISNDPVILARGTYRNDKVYPSVSLTYMSDWWAEIFQLRFGWSETVVRPDLRELTDASYIDARTGYLTDGNPDVRPADFVNIDIRAEWFFANDDTFSITLYRKDITNPIEFYESAASDTNRAREIINAESGQITGLELDGLKSLGFLGESFEPFFVQGNLTIQNTEIKAGAQADAPTNNVRQLSGASNYVANLMVGFDSMNGQHSATLVYNVFGERLYLAGRNGAPDGFELPFHSLDFTYSWYPTELITINGKLQNLLNESVIIERDGVNTFEEKPGMTAALSFNLTF